VLGHMDNLTSELVPKKLKNSNWFKYLIGIAILIAVISSVVVNLDEVMSVFEKRTAKSVKMPSKSSPHTEVKINSNSVAVTPPAKKESTAVRSQTGPVNIALSTSGASISAKFSGTPSELAQLSRLIDNNLDTDLRLEPHILKKLAYEVSFAQPSKVIGISFHQPSKRNPKNYTKTITVKARYPNGKWSKEIRIVLQKDSGEFYTKLAYDRPIAAVMINPKDNWNGHQVYIGDVKIWVKK